LSGERYQPFSAVIPIIINLREFCRNPPNGIPANITTLYSNLLSNLNHYFFGTEFLDILSPNCLLYCLLDPRFKNLEFISKEHEAKADHAHQLLVKLHDEVYSVTKSTVETTAEPEKLDKYSKLYGITSTAKTTARQVCNKYNCESQALVKSDPRDWWKLNADKYPGHAKLAQKFLSQPATSVPCEQLWSDGRTIVSDKRSALDPDSVCMLLVTEHNLHELERIGKPYVWQKNKQ